MSEKSNHEFNPQVAIFRGNEIRKTIFNNEWWFAVNDVVCALTDTPDPKDYIRKMRDRDEELGKGWGQFVTPLSIQTPGGKQNLNCANTEGVFRIIQSIPSPKAEPFKRWLAKVGYERIQEIQDPELAIKRTRAMYKIKGYSDEWIEKRMRGIDVRKKLTDEWQKRGVQGEDEYSILTAEISKAAFGLTPDEYKKHKGLDNPADNLRDHMTDLELMTSTSPLAPLPQGEGNRKREKINFMKYSSGMIRLQRIGDNKLVDSREFRKNPTQTEHILWNCLRNRKCGGFKFRRQQVIDGFIADFYCEAAKLIVELDGGIHETAEQQLIDEHREKVFQSHGMKTIRFQNEAIIDDLPNVLMSIEHNCRQRSNFFSSTPLLAGEGQGVRS